MGIYSALSNRLLKADGRTHVEHAAYHFCITNAASSFDVPRLYEVWQLGLEAESHVCDVCVARNNVTGSAQRSPLHIGRANLKRSPIFSLFTLEASQSNSFKFQSLKTLLPTHDNLSMAVWIKRVCNVMSAHNAHLCMLEGRKGEQLAALPQQGSWACLFPAMPPNASSAQLA